MSHDDESLMSHVRVSVLRYIILYLI